MIKFNRPVTVPCHSRLFQSSLMQPSSAESSLCSVLVVPVLQSRDQTWLCSSRKLGCKKDNCVQMLLCGYSNSNCFIKGCLSLCTNQAVTRGHMMSLFYLHVCYLVLFPVKALHLVLFQFLSGLHILVIVTLIMKIDLHCHPTGWHTYTYLVIACLWFPYSALCDYMYSNLFMILWSLQSMLGVFSGSHFSCMPLPCSTSVSSDAGGWYWYTHRSGSLESVRWARGFA